ncbi:YodC family protein [Bradyrhizobium ganzhouense]|uniref:YodC family protein n=1 Tax=Bradyrhizobium ganzhouense TaxID=1179767 RepID=UPI003CEE6BFE
MELKTGDVVMLKSGGQPLTVAEVKGDDIVCLWMGSEGDLFRETLPLAALDRLEVEDHDEDEDDEEEDDEDEE